MEMFTKREISWNSKQVCTIAKGIANGLIYLHNLKPFPLVCRNLTPTKIFLNEDCTVIKIGGFSEAQFCLRNKEGI